jgi:Na+-transporting NADH:ubiquinone oxidoreductase subunit C
MINKQSNVYTIVYITIMVIVVGAVLALTSMALKDRQKENEQADKKSQILQSVHISTERNTVIADFDKYIVNQLVVNSKGEEVEGQVAFDIDVALEAKKPADERLLPIYVCELPEVGTKYIIPLSGMGLWGPIWGYVSFNADGSTVYGAFFDHQGETPGLGAEITKAAFTDQFPGKQVFKGDNFLPIEVVKKGQKPMNQDVDYVDGISGGTITSKGVSAMFANCLQPYEAWLKQVCAAPGDARPLSQDAGELVAGEEVKSAVTVLTPENAHQANNGAKVTDEVAQE